MGYKESGLKPIFSGYITSVSSVSPITLECEDMMHVLKKTEVKPFRYPKFDLKQFFSEYVPGVNVEIPEDIPFGEVVIKNETSVAFNTKLSFSLLNLPEKISDPEFIFFSFSLSLKLHLLLEFRGKGLPLFPNNPLKSKWTLRDSKSYDTRLVISTYEKI